MENSTQLSGTASEVSGHEPSAEEKNIIVALAAEGRYPEAAIAAQDLTRRFPLHGFGWKALGAMLRNMGQNADALAPMQKAAELSPEDAGAHYNLAVTLQEAGNLGEAERSYRKALQIKPDYPEAYNNLANALYQLGRRDEAEESYRQALQLRPDYADAHNNLANILQERGRLDEAEASYRNALRSNPADPEIHHNLGNTLRAMGRLDEAKASYEQALQLKPDFAEALCYLGLILQELGRVDDAMASYRSALKIKPDYAEAYNNLGNSLRALQRLGDAEASYRQALRIKPQFAAAQCNLGTVLQDLGRRDEAAASYERALQIDPDYAEARWKLAMSSIPIIAGAPEEVNASRARLLHELDELNAWFDGERLELGFGAVGTSQPFYLAYQEQNNREILSKYGTLCARLMRHWQDKQGFTLPSVTQSNTVRVGIVSAHFHSHSVWTAIVKGWFQHLDRGRIELHIFHAGSEQDEETNWAKARAASFEQKSGSFIHFVNVILEKRIEVLIYPEVGMDPTTAKLASLRLAPIQVAAWGHPETTGLPTMDYYLSAEFLEPQDAQNNYTEKLICLPNLGCCYHPAQVQSSPPDFDSLGLDADIPFFLCPGLPFKYAPQHDHVFPEIARKLGRCQFVFFISDASLSEMLRQRLNLVFNHAGLSVDEYCRFIPWQNKPAFYGLMRQADAFLDTIGFSGFNTAMQAVECGLPIVTRDGRFMRGRLASGILRRMGVTELIASSEREYVDLAVRLGQDAEFRANMRHRMETCRPVLFDDVEPVRALEDFIVSVAKRRLPAQ